MHYSLKISKERLLQSGAIVIGPCWTNCYSQKLNIWFQHFFFWKCFKKNYWIFSQLSFLSLKVQSFWLIMENNIIQMADSAGHAVAYTIGPIFKHIIDYIGEFRVQLSVVFKYKSISVCQFISLTTIMTDISSTFVWFIP